MALFVLGALVLSAGLVYRAYAGTLKAGRLEHQRVEELNVTTIEALAAAIDAAGPSRMGTRREQIYAAGIARAMGASSEETEAVRAAALLHDIGKLAIPLQILTKPGPLTDEEWGKVRTHARVGAGLLAQVPFPYPVAPLVASHHERWDGLGYPEGLKGIDIPLGARILAVVDCFDALVSERPYQRTMSVADAFAFLKKESGQAFDPRVVDVFVEEYDRLERELTHAQAEAEAATEAATEVSAVPELFRRLAAADNEVKALTDLAVALGASHGVDDVASMLASTLRSVVPFETCALFLREGDRGVLRCRCSSGVDAERIARFVISEGEGLQGWVVRTERALMNAPPSLDFDAAGAVDIAGPTPLRSAVVCPLIFNSRVLGTLAVYHTKEHAYSDDDRRRLTHAAENAAAVIHRAVVFDEARLSAATDPMTGLPNARAMSIAVAREVARAGRLGTSGAVLAVDVRGVAGLAKDGPRPRDAATVRCAETVRLCLPHPDDMVGAVGRDVFVVLLASASAAEAAVVKTAIEERVAALSSQLGVELSARVGLALFPEEGETFDALWARANKAAGGAAQLTPVSAPTE